MDEKKIKDLRKKVEDMLAKSERSRNSDQFLTIKLWVEHYPEAIKVIDGEKMIKLNDIMLLPREDNVKRIRAIIQNVEHRFLPTDPDVRKKRGISEHIWYQYCKNN